MTINEVYKTFECVKNLSDQLKENFVRIVEAYGRNLPEQLILDNSVYTLHDFNHHCVDIYKIISKYLLNPATSYNKQIGLTPRELYVLDLAVLFHDYSMSNDFTATRNNHSRKSAEYVWNEYQNSSSVFKTNCDLNLEEVRALMAIIEAHSDLKDGSVPENENGLRSPNLRNYDSRAGEPIRASFLAGILRMADELDITSARLGNEPIEARLKKIEKDMQSGKIDKTNPKYQTMLESLYYWKIQHYFSSMAIDDRGVLCIQVDDEYIQECMKAGDSKKKIEEDIDIIVEKNIRTFSEISEEIFSVVDVKIYVLLANIVVKSNILDLKYRNNLC